MATLNPSDITYAVVSETVEGTCPATPALLNVDYIPGNEFMLDAKVLSSDVLKQNRAMAGLAKTGFNTSGTIKTQFRRDTAQDKLLQSAFSGTFAANVLKAGNTDSTLTVEKKMNPASPLYFRYGGMIVKSFKLSVTAGGNAEASYDFVGMNRATSTSIVTGATYAAPVQGPLFTGNDVGTITIGGLTAVYTSFDLSVDHNRDPKFALGQTGSIGTGTSGFRTTKLTVKMFRPSDFSAETLFLPDTPIAVNISLGTGVGNAYTFTLPAVVASIPKDEVSGASALINVEMTATYDATSATDIFLTKS